MRERLFPSYAKSNRFYAPLGVSSEFNISVQTSKLNTTGECCLRQLLTLLDETIAAALQNGERCPGKLSILLDVILSALQNGHDKCSQGVACFKGVYIVVHERYTIQGNQSNYGR